MRTPSRLAAIGALKIAAFYAVAIALMYAPIVFQGRTLVPAVSYPGGTTPEGPWDYHGRKAADIPLDRIPQAYFEAPIDVLSRSLTLRGIWPLWNPYQAAGQPLAAQYSTRVLFPFQVVQNLLGPLWVDAFLLLRLWLTAVFFHLFLLGNGIGGWTTFAGGLFSIFSGPFPFLLSMQEISNAGMMTAISLFLVNRMIGRPTHQNATLNAITFALLLLSGNPEVILFCLILIFSFAAWKSWTSNNQSFSKKDWLYLLGSYGLGMLLAAPLILPFVELMQIGYHAHHAKDAMGTRDPLGLSHLLSMLMPLRDSLTTEWHPDFASNGKWDFIGGFSGISLPILALAGAWLPGPHRALARFSMLFGLVWILKNHAIWPFKWLGYLPLVNRVWTQRWGAHAWYFAFAVAGSIGVMNLLEHGKRWKPSRTIPHPSVRWIPIVVLGLLSAALSYASLHASIVATSTFWLILVLASLGFVLMRPMSEEAFARSLLLILFIELWMWYPRGYLHGDLLRSFFLGTCCLFLVHVFPARRGHGFVLALLFAGTLWIDAHAARGPATRHSPFVPSPAVDFIRQNVGYHRLFGTDGILIPSYASAFQLQDFASTPSMSVAELARLANEGLEMIGEEHITFKGGTRRSQASLYKSYSKYHDLFSAAGVKYLLVPRETDFTPFAPRGTLKLVYENEIRVYENLAVMPRVFFAKRLRYFDDDRSLWRAMQSRTINFFAETAIHHRSVVENFPEYGTGSATIVLHEPDRVEILVHADKHGLVVLSDTLYPGWIAHRNGGVIPIHRANGFMRAVEVEPGENRIAFEYRPASFRWGVGLFLFAIAILAIGGFIPRKRFDFARFGSRRSGLPISTETWYISQG